MFYRGKYSGSLYVYDGTNLILLVPKKDMYYKPGHIMKILKVNETEPTTPTLDELNLIPLKYKLEIL